MKHLLVVMIAALACTLSLSACNTIEGVGKDLQRAGEAIEEEAAD